MMDFYKSRDLAGGMWKRVSSASCESCGSQDELRHLIIAFYLTALVGCGGNAGSQAASLVLQAYRHVIRSCHVVVMSSHVVSGFGHWRAGA